MLILYRRAGDKVYIKLPNGQVATIMVTHVAADGTGVKLGLDFPTEYPILRDNIKVDKPKTLG